MKFSDKTILLISPEEWGHIFVSKHHYAIHLAEKGNRVFFLNPPTSGYRQTESGYPNLIILDYPGFWKGLYRMPRRLRAINVRQVYQKLETMVGSTIDIVWSFDNSVFFDLDVLPKNVLKISHIVDLNQDFNTQQASSTADVCFGVIHEIVQRHQQYNARSYLIRHAVNTHSAQVKASLPGSHAFKVLYFGNLSMKHLNWNLMSQAVRAVEADFIFLGSGAAQVPKDVTHFGNVHFPGKIPADQLMGYMVGASLLVLFYQPSYFKDCASPHKVMEYLSSGKPILSMDIPEYAGQKELIYMASSDEQWVEKLVEIVNHYDKFQNEQLTQERVQFAKDNTYHRRIEEIESILSTLN